MRVELSTKKLEGAEAEKSMKSQLKLRKYEKDWTVIVERLIQALGDENEYVRWGAAGALGELGDVRAVEPLNEALEDENSSVQERVTWALEKIRDEKLAAPSSKYQKTMKTITLEKERSEE
jgi:hypothetical protein